MNWSKTYLLYSTGIIVCPTYIRFRDQIVTLTDFTLNSTLHRKISRLTLYTQHAFISQHKISSQNQSPATNLEKGWIIDSGASAYMTPFHKDCKDIHFTYKIIYLADGSTVLCQQMGNITIPITKNIKLLGSLIFEDVLIVPNLDCQLFSVNAFLSQGHNWVHYSRNNIKLGIKDGPSVNIPITSLQSNAFILDHVPSQNRPKEYDANICNTSFKGTKIDTGLLHD